MTFNIALKNSKRLRMMESHTYLLMKERASSSQIEERKVVVNLDI